MRLAAAQALGVKRKCTFEPGTSVTPSEYLDHVAFVLWASRRHWRIDGMFGLAFHEVKSVLTELE